jgi:hypothetical protein
MQVAVVEHLLRHWQRKTSRLVLEGAAVVRKTREAASVPVEKSMPPLEVVWAVSDAEARRVHDCARAEEARQRRRASTGAR